MSDLESISGSDISEGSEYECDDIPNKKVIMNVTYGRSTIPLHPCLASQYDTLITEENRYTFKQTPESVLVSVTNWGPSIGYVHDEFITYELCSKAIECCDSAICSIKPSLLTKQEYYYLCLQSVSENGWNMKYIPQEIQTQELCDAAIKAICWGYKYCLEKFKTYENSFSAVKRNGQIIEYVPKKLINYELCEAAAKSRYPCLNLIPKEFLTKEICEIAVKADGENVKWVPDEFMSTELAYLAINSPAPSHPSTDMCASNIQYIKAQFLTKDIIVDSAKRWYCTYGRVPKECRTKEVEEAVLEVAPHCIKDMEQTPERCMKVLKQHPHFVGDYIRIENITSEMIEYICTLPEKDKKYIKRNMNKDDFEKLFGNKTKKN
jgi:hypothetical protein